MDYGCFDGQRKLDHTTERLQGGFKVPMETGRNLEQTTERHQRGFKVPMETGSLLIVDRCVTPLYLPNVQPSVQLFETSKEAHGVYLVSTSRVNNCTI